MRILFVGMANSIHTARWVRQLVGTGWDIHVFPVDYHGIHLGLENLTIHTRLGPRLPKTNRNIRSVGAWPLPHGSAFARQIASWLMPDFSDQARELSRVIHRIKPDIVQSLGIQHAGYLCRAAKDVAGELFSPWIVVNWGSDIYLYGRLSSHRERIKSTLAACDYYVAECARDVDLAREFGFSGQAWVLPGGGGFDLDDIEKFRQQGTVSTRRLILLKGYQNFAGRALFGLRAISLAAESLKGYEIGVYSADSDVEIAAELLSQSIEIPITVLKKSTHEDMLWLHGHARASIGLSISDAASTSMLEALVMGAFPIQSNTACTDEWIVDGQTGFVVPPEDPEKVAEAIRRAVSDDNLVDNAAVLNAKVVEERLSARVIRAQAQSMYEHILEETKTRQFTKVAK